NQTLDELTDAFEAAAREESVGVIVLTGAGGKAFCTGGDVNEEDAFDPVNGRAHHRRLLRLAEVMRNCGKPVIAAVRGYCLGGGNSLMLLCDLTIATESSRFGQVGPKMGSSPLWWSTQLLPRLVGEKKAREIVMLCRQYTAAEAERMGWINRVVPDDALEAEVAAWSAELLAKSPQALRLAKLSLNAESDQLWGAVAHGLGLLAFAHGTDEFHEGTQAFLEKRRPDWERFRRGPHDQIRNP
ncbi:MAG TPA: enoyl-CoA hydratase-related protein, partial [Symbiobacteriaceae bacterium]|nr:enoyl-CoA hydratase-related protein [Symbiobacteriaceae bacterium]